MSRIKQEIERLGMGDIWESRRDNDKNIWIRMTKRCTEIRRQEKYGSYDQGKKSTNIV
jgi:hypothetical protein